MSINLEAIRNLCAEIHADGKHFVADIDLRPAGCDHILCEFGEREITWCFMSTPQRAAYTAYTATALNMLPALVAEVERLRTALSEAHVAIRSVWANEWTREEMQKFLDGVEAALFDEKKP